MANNIEGLLPCPFCGGEATEKHKHNHNAVTCGTCGASLPQSDIGYGDAGKLWNRRAVEASARALAQGEPGEPVGRIVLFGSDPGDKEVSWTKGKMPPVGSTLFISPTASTSAAQSHDYPACAIFRGGRCTCDQDSGGTK